MPDMKPQTFNPDHVMMHEVKEGELLNDFNQPILLNVLENSKIMQLGKFQDMAGKSEKEFTYWADKPGAYWVGEGQKIRTTKPSLVSAKMRSHKLGVIVVASREFLNYTYAQFFDAMKPQIAEQFYKKFDEAGLLNIDNPFTQSVAQSVTSSGNLITGPINEDNVLKLEDVLLEHDVEANAIVSKRQNRTALRQIRNEITQESIYDRSANTLDGLPVVDLKSDELKKGELYAGDFDKMFYGIPYNMSYKISEDGQLSTVQNQDGSPVNLFEQELIALRVTMDVAFHIADDKAFAKLDATGSTTEPAAETV